MTPLTQAGAVIIVFGAAVRANGQPGPAMRARVEAAVRLGRTLTHPAYLPTGGTVRHGPAEAVLMTALLRDAGVEPGRILAEPTALNTLRSVRACRALLGSFTGPVYAATCPFHMARCLLLLRIAGVHALPCPADSGRAGVYRWAREAAGLPVDALIAAWWRVRGRFGAGQHEVV